MRIEYRAKVNKKEKSEIWQLLCECDREFIPPLSAREKPGQSDFRESPGKFKSSVPGPLTYYRNMIGQKFILAKEDGRTVGFMTFISFKDYLYISTICVGKKYRNRKTVQKMYEYMKTFGKKLTVRTWSLNGVHIHILKKMGFRETQRIKDDRGKGIDTIYYER